MARLIHKYYFAQHVTISALDYNIYYTCQVLVQQTHA